MYANQEDNNLVDLLHKDDPNAFEEIYSRYSSNMFLYAIKILNNKAVCEDIVQIIFIDLWSKKTETKITNLSTYLFRAVKYQIFNHLRNRKLSDEDLTRLNIIDVSMNISKQMEYDELEKSIKLHVKKLPKRCRQIFILSRFQHKSNKEIAQELDISVQAVKNQISKALQSIRLKLQQEELVFFNFLYFK